MLSREVYDTYTSLLKSELIEATGCTEPIALALAAAKARSVLGEMPEEVEIYCSGNIVKNVKAVVVPNSGGLKGIPVAALLGIVAGDPDASLQVISHVDDEGRKALKEAMEHVRVKVILAERVPPLYIRIKVRSGYHTAEVEIAQTHTNFTKIVKDDEVIFSKDFDRDAIVGIETDLMNIDDIIEYAETVDLDDVRETIERQIADNTAISNEGLKNRWGESVGQTLLEAYGNSIVVRARAAAAAGSDARMNGCAMPVVINSGSGNQGMTVSLPVIEYAKELNVSHEKLLRAHPNSTIVCALDIVAHGEYWDLRYENKSLSNTFTVFDNDALEIPSQLRNKQYVYPNGFEDWTIVATFEPESTSYSDLSIYGTH